MKVVTANSYQKHIQQILEVIKDINPERVILFGSVAVGRFKEDSDLDICVIKKGDKLKIKRSISRKLWEGDYDWEVEPDIHVYDPIVYQDWLSRGDPFLTEIEKGKVLYARED